MIHIHKHTILTKLKIPGPAWDQQMAWVRGYILALEDILDDLRDMSMKPYPTAHIREKVTETLESARRTLAAMQETEDEAISKQGEHGFSKNREDEGCP